MKHGTRVVVARNVTFVQQAPGIKARATQEKEEGNGAGNAGTAGTSGLDPFWVEGSWPRHGHIIGGGGVCCRHRRIYRHLSGGQYGLAVSDLLEGAMDPTSRNEALAGEDGNLWHKAAAEEYGSLMEQNVFIREERSNNIR